MFFHNVYFGWPACSDNSKQSATEYDIYVAFHVHVIVDFLLDMSILLLYDVYLNFERNNNRYFLIMIMRHICACACNNN